MYRPVPIDYSKLTYQDIKGLVLNRLRDGNKEPDLSNDQISWAYNEAMKIVLHRNIGHDSKKLRLWMYHLTFVFCKKLLGTLSNEMEQWLYKAEVKEEVSVYHMKSVSLNRPYFNYMNTYED
jgi:hypothetical protein